jgi:membrane protein
MGSWTPAVGWKRIAIDTWNDAGEDNVSLVAAGVAFYAFLAFVPLLTALVLAYGLFADPVTVARDIVHLFEILPASVATIAADQMASMSQGSDARTGLALAVTLAIAVYGASKAADAIMTALNIVYEVKECRGFVGRLLTALGMTAGALFLLLLALGTVSALGFLESLLPGLGGVTGALLRLLCVAGAGAVMMGLLALVYRFVPCRPNAVWRWITPGSVLATLLWLALTAGFGLYVANFGNYNATYGSLGAVIAFLTWLYFTAYIILFGAELNAILEIDGAKRPRRRAKAA